MQTAFAKYEGAGNDFILIDNRSAAFVPDGSVIARLCDRHFGIGADGLMTLTTDADAQCMMHYYNADGSEGEMCGNGARCFALFAEHSGMGGDRFRAMDGLHAVSVRHTGKYDGEVELGMIDVTRISCGDGWWFLNTGVPHYVEFVPLAAETDVPGRGRSIRRDTNRFPQGTNVNFVEITGVGALRMRTYERGVERETLACGTGATAAALITNYALQHDTCSYDITVPGGRLRVRFSHEPGTQTYTDIRLTGPARRVFEGVFDSDSFDSNHHFFIHENIQGARTRRGRSSQGQTS